MLALAGSLYNWWTSQFRNWMINTPEFNLLLFGPSGHGKSSTGNSILNRSKYDSDGFKVNSETTRICSGETVFENYKLKVFDCPPCTGEKLTNKITVPKISGSVMRKLIKLSPNGFHAVLIVIQYGHELYQRDESVVSLIKEVFGEDSIAKNAICVVTSGDKFRKKVREKDFHSWCRQQQTDSVLGRIFQACSYRCVLFDNFTEDARIRKEQVQQLLSMVRITWPQTVSIKGAISVSPTMRVKPGIHVLIETAANQIQFQQQVEFAINYNTSFKSDSKMCVLIVGATGHINIEHSDFRSEQDFRKALLSAPYLEPCDCTENALAISHQETLSSSAGQGAENMPVLVMVTQGVFKNEKKATQEAEQIKSSGTLIMVVAVGSVSRQMVSTLASDPDGVFLAHTYDELPEVVEDVVLKTMDDSIIFITSLLNNVFIPLQCYNTSVTVLWKGQKVLCNGCVLAPSAMK